VSLAFLDPATAAPDVVAESPLASVAAAAGGELVARDGWRLPVRFGDPAAEAAACADAVGWADASHLGKVELQAGEPGILEALAGGLRTGTAVRHAGAWWCLLTPVRALVLADPGAGAGLAAELRADARLTVTDVTTQLAALRIAGPQARETFARFCALDLRPGSLPVAGIRPGSVARIPGYVLREREDVYLALVGAAYAEYLWTVASDAGERLGGRPVGVDAIGGPDA
jgi:heterotetrameric sarcosine oxidase gamma subunit